jgi:hypothetical protein
MEYAFSHDQENYTGRFPTPQDAIRAAYKDAAESIAEGEQAGLSIGVLGPINGADLIACGVDLLREQPHPQDEEISDEMLDGLRKRIGDLFRDWCGAFQLHTTWTGVTKTVDVCFDVDPADDRATLANALAAYKALDDRLESP